MSNITSLQASSINNSTPKDTKLKPKALESNTDSKTINNMETSEKKTDGIPANTSVAATYKPSEEKTEDATYKANMEKVIAMKEETEQRLVELLSNTISKSTLKQLGGIRGFLDKFKAGEIKAEDVEFEITDEAVEKATAETGPDGYWGAEQTSDRFLEFAIALSGDDPSKADMLLDAVKEGYKMAEEIWGGELPELSQKTLEMTIEKFESWRDGTDSSPKDAVD